MATIHSHVGEGIELITVKLNLKKKKLAKYSSYIIIFKKTIFYLCIFSVFVNLAVAASNLHCPGTKP